MRKEATERFDLCALTLTDVLVVVAVVTVLAIAVGTGMIQAKRKSQRIDCAGNLKQVGLAPRIWPPDSSDRYPMSRSTNEGGTLEVAGDVWRDFLVMANELQTPKVLVCPADNGRVAATNWNELRNANIS